VAHDLKRDHGRSLFSLVGADAEGATGAWPDWLRRANLSNIPAERDRDNGHERNCCLGRAYCPADMTRAHWKYGALYGFIKRKLERERLLVTRISWKTRISDGEMTRPLKTGAITA
jgi:hypothetical protein